MERIRQILWDQLADAQERRDNASREFHAILADVPSGLPHPDGTLRITIAGEAARHALREYTDACKRLTDFVVHGTVPEDLLRPEDRTSSGKGAVG